ncbi:MAG: cadherin repeat domain-containing protein, partial [Acidimicrobiia bacterium]|nr:cadherin repeat domain-containing protein [Acidimicrobiia bacterium]
MDAGDTLTFSIGTGSDVVAIDPTSGVLTVSGALDHELTPTVVVEVVVTDLAGLDARETITLTINDVDEAPVIAAQTMHIDENSVITDIVGTVAAEDPEGAAISYGIISGNAAGVFAIDTATGVIRIADDSCMDFETCTVTYALEVQVTDPSTQFTSAIVTVEIDDVNEDPSIVVGSSYNIDENSPFGTVVTGDAIGVADVDAGDTAAYSITDGSTVLKIDETSGVLSVNDSAGLDFEGIGDVTVEVTVTDSGGRSDVAIVLVTVNDMNDAPEITMGTSYSVPENSSPTPVTGDLPIVTDEDVPANGLTFSISGGNDPVLFAIDSGTGALSVTSDLNHELVGSYDLTIRVTDDGTPVEFAEAVITVDVSDVNEAPVITVDAAGYTVPEDAVVDTVLTGAAPSAADPDVADTQLWTIEGGTGAALFGIDPATGALDVAGALNHEAAASYDLTIRVTDGGTPGLFDEKTVTITVSDVNEAPVMTVDAAGYSVAEDAVVDTVLTGAAPSAADVDDLDTEAWTIEGGTGAALFGIDPATGALDVAGALNHEAAASHTLTIRVTDSGGLFAEETVTITIGDVNEAPVVTADQVFEVPVDAVNTDTVADVEATDVDDGDVLTYG